MLYRRLLRNPRLGPTAPMVNTLVSGRRANPITCFSAPPSTLGYLFNRPTSKESVETPAGMEAR